MCELCEAEDCTLSRYGLCAECQAAEDLAILDSPVFKELCEQVEKAE